MHRVALYWLRRDLRLTDNPALQYACERADRVVLAYIHAPDEEQPWQPGAASQWWLHHSLTSLNEALAKRNQRLIVRTGPSLAALRDLIRESEATLVVWNRLYEPAIVARDTKVKVSLQEDGVEVESHNAALLFEPWAIRTQQGTPFKVFTPYWRVCAAQLDQVAPPLPAPKTIGTLDRQLVTGTLDSLQLLPTVAWDIGIAAKWQPGERGALRRLQIFEGVSDQYPDARDRPAVAGTSLLSPHLHFGEISPRQLCAALLGTTHTARNAQGVAAFLRELGWREFAHHLLYHFPQTTDEPFNSKFIGLKWKKDSAGLRAWQGGKTGIPLVDAGMRELWTTGTMHNRVRMIVASVLTKNLGIHWREGARWFWETLVDADLASNSLGWQWVAGSGADAAPYYRIFNPVLQSERFDGEGIYLRRWLPEIGRLSNKHIHSPWTASEDELTKAGITLGKTYPRPIVDLKASRDAALQNYRRWTEQPAAPG